MRRNAHASSDSWGFLENITKVEEVGTHSRRMNITTIPPHISCFRPTLFIINHDAIVPAAPIPDWAQLRLYALDVLIPART